MIVMSTSVSGARWVSETVSAEASSWADEGPGSVSWYSYIAFVELLANREKLAAHGVELECVSPSSPPRLARPSI